MKYDGYISIHRKIQGHWIFKDPHRLRAWIIILLNVNHSDKETVIGNQKFICKRGESLLSLESWATKFGRGWNKSKVRRFLKLLEKCSMVVQKSERKTTRITVCNYDTYQSDRNSNETKVKRKRNASETQVKPNNNDNNDNNDKKINNGRLLKAQIEEIYQAYPKKVGKKAALKKIELALREVGFKELLKKTKLYAECRMGQDKQYTPHPETWFNKGKYADDPEEWKPAQPELDINAKQERITGF